MNRKNFLVVLFIFGNLVLQAQEAINQFDASGKRHGVWKKYYPNSKQLRYQGTFDHGKEKGIFKFYCETCNKQPTAIKDFSKNDTLAEVSFYTPKGTLVSKGKMQGKKKRGKWIYYKNDGKTLVTEENYNNNGKLEGLKIIYYPNKNKAQQTTFVNGIKEGAEIYYSYEGKVLKAFNYKNNELQGPATYYDADGKLLIAGQYKNGRKHGLWKYYKNGKILKEETYPRALKKDTIKHIERIKNE